jgi:hypothetical protein
MAAKIEIDIGPIGFRIQFRGVREQQFECLRWHWIEGFRQVVASIIMGVIHPNHPEAGLHLRAFVNQHPHAELLEGDGHIGLIVVAKNTEHSSPAADRVQQPLNMPVHRVAGPMHFETVITGEDAQVYRDLADAVAESPGQAGNAVNVQVGKMQDAKSMQPWRQVREYEAQMAYTELERVAEPSPIEAGSPQNQLQ